MKRHSLLLWCAAILLGGCSVWDIHALWPKKAEEPKSKETKAPKTETKAPKAKKQVAEKKEEGAAST